MVRPMFLSYRLVRGHLSCDFLLPGVSLQFHTDSRVTKLLADNTGRRYESQLLWQLFHLEPRHRRGFVHGIDNASCHQSIGLLM